MDELPRDERMRQLQRLAYGAVASAAERTAALAELEKLRREREASQADAAIEASAPGAPLEPVPTFTPALVVAEASEDGADASARRFRWAIAAGTAALLVGVAVGWQLGTTRSTPESIPESAATTMAPNVLITGAERIPVPVSGSAAIEVFDRPQVEGDIPPAELVPNAAHALDTSSYRLLITRPDGVTLHAFRAENGVDVCMMVVVPDLGIGAACTTDGSFPGEGLTQELYLQGQGLMRTAWNADGSALISAPPSR
jgi:hypothetical protein